MVPFAVRFVKGYVRVRICGGSPKRFMNMCAFRLMPLWDIAPKDGGYEFYMYVSDFKRIRPIARKTRTKPVLAGKKGLPFFIYRNRGRKVFFGGIILCFLLVKLFSGLLWDIHFEGNLSVPSETLLSFLWSRDVRVPMCLSDIRCGAIEESLRGEFDEIVWASVSLEGSRLNVNIKENDGCGSGPDISKTPADIVALKDGVITKMITRRGTPLVHEGDEVKKGDVLVSGKIDIMNDSQEVTGSHYTSPDADIFARTERIYSDTMSTVYNKKIYGREAVPWKRRLTQYYLKAGPITLRAGIPGDRFPVKDVLTRERRLRLGENFVLPLCVGTKTYRAYTLKKSRYPKDELRRILTANYRRFSEELEEKGIQIIENNVKIYIKGDAAEARGALVLNERIGANRGRQIAGKDIADGS